MQVVFYDEIESVRTEAKALKSSGIQIIIALGHAGWVNNDINGFYYY